MTCVIVWANVLKLNRMDFIVKINLKKENATMYHPDFSFFGLLTQSWLGVVKSSWLSTPKNWLTTQNKKEKYLINTRIIL